MDGQMETGKIADQTGATEGFWSEIAQHIPALRVLAKALTRNAESAADLTQETLAKAWRARLTFTAGTNVRAWLFTIMRNQFRSDRRRAWRQVPWDEKAAERMPAPADEQNWFIELDDAARAIGMLSKRQRDALILASVGGLSSADVGAIIRCPPKAVKSRVSRARHAIRAMLDGTQPLKTKRNERGRENIAGLVRRLEHLTANAA